MRHLAGCGISPGYLVVDNLSFVSFFLYQHFNSFSSPCEFARAVKQGISAYLIELHQVLGCRLISFTKLVKLRFKVAGEAMKDLPA